jgi:hypothetical protein
MQNRKQKKKKRTGSCVIGGKWVIFDPKVVKAGEGAFKFDHIDTLSMTILIINHREARGGIYPQSLFVFCSSLL